MYSAFSSAEPRRYTNRLIIIIGTDEQMLLIVLGGSYAGGYL